MFRTAAKGGLVGGTHCINTVTVLSGRKQCKVFVVFLSFLTMAKWHLRGSCDGSSAAPPSRGSRNFRGSSAWSGVTRSPPPPPFEPRPGVFHPSRFKRQNLECAHPVRRFRRERWRTARVGCNVRAAPVLALLPSTVDQRSDLKTSLLLELEGIRSVLLTHEGGGGLCCSWFL